MTLADKAASFARTETEEGTVGQEQTKACGGCGATASNQRCMGCLHDFGDDASAWVHDYLPKPNTRATQDARALRQIPGETDADWIGRLRATLVQFPEPRS
jgi:hypothetical protein